ncbi:hypothetical protein JYK13_19360 [Citrobacter sp. ku-bf4]|uniref:O-unit flippase-like protein n=1 Tax=Citrobacter TaxID=544 RepID=UPI00197D2662|nr:MULTISPECIES: O-unit flippase-like protein [Citrobacter]MBN6046141.1 hypothetical protein [Citrobacter sp. ku-bf4]MBS0827657.1 hypothetical protein [Citrobacter amalonaticus]
MIKRESQLIVGLCNQVINILCPFLITIIGLKNTNAEIGSIWLIFLSMVVLVNLFDFGMSPTIIRNVSYVVGGARELAKDGLDDVKFSNGTDYSLLKRLLCDIKKIYRTLTVVAFFIILVGGGLYFYHISPPEEYQEVILSWGAFAFGLLMSLYYLYYTPILCGLGIIQKAYLANIIGRLAWLVLTLVAMKYFPGLISLSLAFLISVFINRLVINIFYKKNIYIKELRNVIASKVSTIPVIAHNATKLGVVSLGSFLISRATILIAGASLPLAVAGEYTFSLQIFMALLAVGNVFVTVKVPELSRLVMVKETAKLRMLIIKIITVSLFLYMAGFVCFYFLQGFIIAIFGAKVGFLQNEYLILLAVVYLLELNHTICATILTTANKIPFVKPSLISGLLIVIFSMLVVKYSSLAILGLIGVQLIIQLFYNNWKWPVCVYKGYIK